MATLAEILTVKYPGSGDGRIAWKLDGADGYAKLTWLGTDPKPSEATLRALSAEVDAEMAAKRAAEAALLRFVVANPDAVLRGFEIVSNCIAAIYNVLSATQKTTIQNMAGNPVGQFQALQTHLAAMRNGN